MSTIDVDYMLNLCIETGRFVAQFARERNYGVKYEVVRCIYIVECPLRVDFHRSAIIFHIDYRFTGG